MEKNDQCDSSIVVHGKTSSIRVCTHEGEYVSLREVHFVALYFVTSLGLKNELKHF